MDKELWAFGLTFRLPARVNVEPHKYNYLKQFIREIMDTEQIIVAYIGMYAPCPFPHIHLALTYQSKDGAPKSIDFAKWERRWNQIVRYKGGGLKFEPLYDSDAWQGYVMRHGRHPDSVSFWYNNELLKQLHLGE